MRRIILCQVLVNNFSNDFLSYHREKMHTNRLNSCEINEEFFALKFIFDKIGVATLFEKNDL